MLGKNTNHDSSTSAARPSLPPPAQRRAAAIERAEKQYGVRVVSLGEVSRQVQGVGRGARDRTVRAELFATDRFNGKSFVRYEEYPDQLVPQFEIADRDPKPDPEPPLVVSRRSMAQPSNQHPPAPEIVTVAPFNPPVEW